MLRRLLQLLLAWIAFTSIVVSASTTAVHSKPRYVMLDETNFDAAVARGRFLVFFFLKDCGHCKRFHPEFDNASMAFTDDQVKFGKVDGGVERELADRFRVTGYPTLKYFENGIPVRLGFFGGSDAERLIEFLHRMLQPPIRVVKSAAELEAFAFHRAPPSSSEEGEARMKDPPMLKEFKKLRDLSVDPVTFVLFHPESGSIRMDNLYETAATEYRGKMFLTRIDMSLEAVKEFSPFFGRGSINVGDIYRSRVPVIVRLEALEKEWGPNSMRVIRKGLLEISKNFSQTLEYFSFATVSRLSALNFHDVAFNSGRRRLVMGFVNSTEVEGTERFREVLRQARATGDLADTFIFGSIDWETFKSYLQEFIVNDPSPLTPRLPRVVVYDGPKEIFWVDDELMRVNDVYGLVQFLNDVSEGRVEYHREGFLGKTWRFVVWALRSSFLQISTLVLGGLIGSAALVNTWKRKQKREEEEREAARSDEGKGRDDDDDHQPSKKVESDSDSEGEVTLLNVKEVLRKRKEKLARADEPAGTPQQPTDEVE